MGIVRRLRAGWSGVRVLVGARDFSLLQSIQTGSKIYPASYWVNIGVTSQGLKWLGREFNYSSLCIAEVKNEWTYTSAPSLYPHDTDRETFSLSVGILGYIICGSSLIVRSKVFTVVTVRIFLGCDTCILVEVYRRFGGTCSSSSM